MKKLIIKIAAIFAFFFLINLLYIQTNYWKSENHVNQFDGIPYEIELGNLGSSHGMYGIKYDVVPELNAWNFSLHGQPYCYDIRILRYYLNHFKKNAVVLIPVSYFGITQRLGYEGMKSRYYRILPKEEIENWKFKEYITWYKFPILSAQDNILKIFHDISKAAMSPYYNRTTSLSEERLQEYCEIKYEQWNDPATDKGMEGFNLNIKEVSDIIDFCYAHDLIPVVITTPINDALNQKYAADDFFTTFDKFKYTLTDKYQNLLYLDYSRNDDFCKNNNLFTDGDHLNNFGAEKFTKTLISDLRKNGLLK